MEQPINSMWVTGYTLDGYRLSLTLEVKSVAEAIAKLSEIREAGILPREPGVQPGEDKETITTVVYREYTGQDGKEKKVIDGYPEWRGKYGTYRIATIYINGDSDIAEFEAQTGLKLSALNAYPAQNALVRTQGTKSKWEHTCKPFDIIRTEHEYTDASGEVKTGKRFERYANPLTTPASENGSGEEPGNAEGQPVHFVKLESFANRKGQNGFVLYTDDERKVYQYSHEALNGWATKEDAANPKFSKMLENVPGTICQKGSWWYLASIDAPIPGFDTQEPPAEDVPF